MLICPKCASIAFIEINKVFVSDSSVHYSSFTCNWIEVTFPVGKLLISFIREISHGMNTAFAKILIMLRGSRDFGIC